MTKKHAVEEKHTVEGDIRELAAALAEVIDEVKDRNRPLADRAQAVLSEAVQLAVQVATK